MECGEKATVFRVSRGRVCDSCECTVRSGVGAITTVFKVKCGIGCDRYKVQWGVEKRLWRLCYLHRGEE